MASESFWWCSRCNTEVPPFDVTFQEYHDGCGGTCEVREDKPDVWAAARAWQAFRDFLDGTPEQWQQYAEGMYAYGRQLGWEDV